MTPSHHRSGTVPGLGVCLFLCACSSVQADVRPSVKVRIPPHKLQPAFSGQSYEGEIEVRVAQAGQLADIQLSGEGWRVSIIDAKERVDLPAGGVLSIAYEGTPVDASKSLHFYATFDGRRVHKQINLSNDFLLNADKPGKIAGTDAQGKAAAFQPTFQFESVNTARGQDLHFHGRIAYLRPSVMGGPQDTVVGVDNVYYEIIDEDDISDEVIYAGLTDINGNFDVQVNWDDCDISGCDDPDIYIRWELYNGVVNVQHSNILQDDFSWSTEDTVIDDFTGSEVDFGTMMPADTGQHPPLHIHNGITRAFRFMQLNTGIAVEHVDAVWPDSDNGAYYDGEINIGPNEQWNEGTIVHEYGHHILDNYAANVSPDYCNDFCDGEAACTAGDDCDKEGHCTWCPETDHDAWNEGFPDWLGGAVIRTFLSDYGLQALSINDGRFNVESIGTCCQDGMTYSALVTQGYITALLQDMEDGQDDDHSGGTYVCDDAPPTLDCLRDSLVLGPKQILDVALNNDPVTPLQFLQSFRARFPQFDQDLWSTANNVSPTFTFPVPTPEVQSQTMACAVNMAGNPMTIEALGNGSSLLHQWQKFNVDLVDGPGLSGAKCPQLLFDPLAPAQAGIYRARVSTCDLSSSTMSLPIRVSVLPARGAGTNGGSWGRNNGGQLGRGVFDITGPQYPSGVPAPMVALSDAISISQGGDSWHKLAVKSNGDVWGWGYNTDGQLGKSPFDLPYTHTPFKIEGLSNIVQTASGSAFSMALQADGKVFTWGDNDYGTRGDGNYYGYNPALFRMTDLDCVVSIAAGSYHAAAVKSDGTVWIWGYGYDGQLGFDSTALPFRSVFAPHEVPGISDAVAVAAGGFHTLVLRSDGTVLAFGRNDEGQLGDGTTNSRFTPMSVPGLTNVAAVRAGSFNSHAILQDGTVRSWGSNGGALGNGLAEPALIPVQPLDIGTVVDVAGGYYHTMYLRTNGTVWVSGWNVYGELGPRPYPEPLKPLPVAGINNAFAIGAGSGTSFGLSAGVGPYIWQQPENKIVLVGQPATFSIQNLGTPSFTYQWSRNGNDLVSGNGFGGVNTPTLTLNPVAASMAGTYRVRVENAFGFTLSVMVTLAVNCPNGDGDCDGAIDQVDIAGLVECLGGPNGPRPAACDQAAFGNFDTNNDNDVDLRDAAIVQDCFAADALIDPACAQP